MHPDDIYALKANADLVAIVERDLGPGRKSGVWVTFCCPFHDDNSPSLGVTNNDRNDAPPIWRCFACGKRGDAISWYKERDGMTFEEAITELGGDPSADNGNGGKPRPPRPKPIPQPQEPPPYDWHLISRDVIRACKDSLWSAKGERALDWLRGRGLSDGIIEDWDLGFNSRGHKVKGQYWLDRGITIPNDIGGRCWGINVRRAKGKPKYRKMSGSKTGLYGADFLHDRQYAFFTEGEFDALLLHQEIHEIAAVVTMGANTNRLCPVTWGRYLLHVPYILAAYDLDKAGRNGLAELMGTSARVKDAPLPPELAGAPVKDITDYYKAHGSLKLWAEFQIKRTQNV